MKNSEKLAVKSAKELQAFCDAESCKTCIFAIPGGHCELNFPTTWDLEQFEENNNV